MKDNEFIGKVIYFGGRLISYGLREVSARIPVGSRFCCYCQLNSPCFMPYRRKDISSFVRELDVVGSDLSNYLCPKCGSNDRERHSKLYFDALNLQNYVVGKNVLHFAPELHFSKYIQLHGPLNYIKADLYPTDDSVKQVDMMAMGFRDCEFDLIVANHVLEHVHDIEIAMQELWRVLKPGGFAILQTPYSKVLHSTFEDQGIVTPEARLQAYGQEDHVRIFGRDIFKFIASHGFVNRVKTHAFALPEFDATYYGVNINEPLFLFERTP